MKTQDWTTTQNNVQNDVAALPILANQHVTLTQFQRRHDTRNTKNIMTNRGFACTNGIPTNCRHDIKQQTLPHNNAHNSHNCRTEAKPQPFGKHLQSICSASVCLANVMSCPPCPSNCVRSIVSVVSAVLVRFVSVCVSCLSVCPRTVLVIHIFTDNDIVGL